MVKLKPCPFCDAEWQHRYGYQEIVHKDTCYLIGNYVFFDTDSGLRDRWNTRATDPLIEELAEKIADHYCKDELLKEMAEALQGMADIYYGRDNQPIAGAFAKRMDDVLRKYHEQEADNAK